MKSRILVIPFLNGGGIENHINELNDPYDFYRGHEPLKDKRILFLIELNHLGYNLDLLNWLTSLEDNAFEGSLAAIIVSSNNELYTKSAAQDLIFQTNKMGLAYLGHSVIEIIEGYKNFETWQKTMEGSLEVIAKNKIQDLVRRLINYEKNPHHKVLALHASAYQTSNTLGLWHKVKKHLKCHVDEIHIENGTVVDCKGCPFQTCMHYGKHHSCFYGGIMVEEVLPKIEESDIIVWVCPNYNDSISANLLAVINRLTVLYRQISFYDKAFFSVIVSGNSGSDSVAKQLIGSLNINKGFFLPARFAIMAIANEPLKILEISGIDLEAGAFADQINTLCDGVKK